MLKKLEVKYLESIIVFSFYWMKHSLNCFTVTPGLVPFPLYFPQLISWNFMVDSITIDFIEI